MTKDVSNRSNETVDHEQEQDSRRNIVKKAVVVGGMTVAVSKWKRPVVDSVVIPIHAQSSQALTAGIVVP